MNAGDPSVRPSLSGWTNPLGTCALYLSANGLDTLYRIYGTNYFFSIGIVVSSGCIRLSNAGAIDLANRMQGGRVLRRVSERPSKKGLENRAFYCPRSPTEYAVGCAGSISPSD